MVAFVFPMKKKEKKNIQLIPYTHTETFKHSNIHRVAKRRKNKNPNKFGTLIEMKKRK